MWQVWRDGAGRVPHLTALRPVREQNDLIAVFMQPTQLMVHPLIVPAGSNTAGASAMHHVCIGHPALGGKLAASILHV